MSATILSLYEQIRQAGDPNQPILRWIDSRLNTTFITREQLELESNQRAHFLHAHGCEQGDRVLIRGISSVEVWYSILGALKCGAVPCVLFPDFGEDALITRLAIARANFFITDTLSDYFSAEIQNLSSIKSIFCTQKATENVELLSESLKNQPTTPIVSPSLTPDSPAFLTFTSGSTGFPKAVVHRHQIGAAIHRSMQNVLHVRADDIYWCTAHPAWITGMVYGVIGPLITPCISIQYGGLFHPKRWMPILQDQQVTTWYTAPTALRSLMAQPESFYHDYSFSALRAIFSVGEPLNPVVYHWGKKVFGREIYDTWFQTEAGTIRIANQPESATLPGWMGKPVDDTFVAILDEAGKHVEENQIGRLCLQTGWESAFVHYFDQPTATQSKFSDGWYVTGDLALRNEEGQIQFVGRDDDVINTSGHLVGPFEVESVLVEQEEVIEAAVVAVPDELTYEKIAAFLVLRQDTTWNSALETQLKVAVTTKLSAYAAPRVFFIVDALPKNDAGKILRRELRKRADL